MNTAFRRVLVVDDDDEAARALADVLERWFHCQVHTTNDGADAIEQVTLNRPDAVLVKALMPGMSGTEVAGVLRRLFNGSRPALIAVTDAGSDRRHRQLLETGFDAWVVEPLDISQLMSALARCEAARATSRHRSA